VPIFVTYAVRTHSAHVIFFTILKLPQCLVWKCFETVYKRTLF